MPARKVAVAAEVPAELVAGLAEVRTRLAVPGEFGAEVLEAAARAAEHPRLPDLDRTDLPLITIKNPDVVPGLTAELVLRFSKAGEGTVIVPVVTADQPDYITITPSATPSI